MRYMHICTERVSSIIFIYTKVLYVYIYCVHFRFGRFGDELLFGAQTYVLYVHFGSRPKWTCKVQHKGFVFLPGVSWWSLGDSLPFGA